jgi:hypothetical protein
MPKRSILRRRIQDLAKKAFGEDRIVHHVAQMHDFHVWARNDIKTSHCDFTRNQAIAWNCQRSTGEKNDSDL